MNSLTDRALHHTATQWLEAGLPAVIVSVDQIKGSTPRETGTRMLVSLSEVDGTVGGGNLEWQAIELARQHLTQATQRAPSTQGEPLPEAPEGTWTRRFPLGPTLGQCCGGMVVLRFATLSQAELQAWPRPPARFHLEVHGAGHVGQALIKLLADIDCTVRWIDERAQDDTEGQPPHASGPGMPSDDTLLALPPHIQWLPTDAAHAEVKDAPPGACHVVLTHRHDLDLRISEAILRRGDFDFLGLIGSKTKRAQFLHRLTEHGIAPDTLARMQCPIGLPGLNGKEPAVIAISVMAQLLQHTSR